MQYLSPKMDLRPVPNRPGILWRLMPTPDTKFAHDAAVNLILVQSLMSGAANKQVNRPES
jgi:hypothetical protein